MSTVSYGRAAFRPVVITLDDPDELLMFRKMLAGHQDPGVHALRAQLALRLESLTGKKPFTDHPRTVNCRCVTAPLKSQQQPKGLSCWVLTYLLPDSNELRIRKQEFPNKNAALSWAQEAAGNRPFSLVKEAAE